MTHTLHPEIIDDIVNSMNHYVDEHMYHALWMKKVLEKHLWPYLLPPSQHLKDETLDMKNHRSVLLGWDKWVAWWDSSCDVYWYYNGWKFYITNIEHRVEDNEPLPESKSKNILQNWQPKVDWSEWDDIQYYRHDGYGWGRRIPGKLKQWVKAIIHAWDIHGIVNFGEIRKPVFEEELKQSTPKIDKINIAYMEWCWEQTVWEEPIIVKKINEVIDYINNKDLLTKL